MSIFAPFDKPAYAVRERWGPDWLWNSGHDLHWQLRRRLGRRVCVGTECARKRGRLIHVARDHISLLRKGRVTLIRIDAICWIRPVRPRRRRPSRCRRRC